MVEVDRVRQNRVRRAVARRGFRLRKTRRVDPAAWDYGSYRVEGKRIKTRTRVFANLAELEAWLEATP